MIVGAGVVGIRKNQDGSTTRPPGLYQAWARLTVLGVSEESSVVDVSDKVDQVFWIVDDSRTKVWQYDSSTVYVPFDLLQRALRMDASTSTDTAGKSMQMPARTSDIRIALKPGADLNAAAIKIEEIVNSVMASHEMSYTGMDALRVQTWLEFNAQFISAVEKEKVLVTMLFSIISIVAIFLIFCIFYMIVVEKTKDIGIIKSVGATSSGVAGIFLGYGLAIGIVGSFLGLASGYLVIHNINWLHTKMGDLMGVQIWSPETYAFDTIPNSVDPTEVMIIMGIAVIASVLGALVPAMRAAQLQPVEALRWE
jgi:lipoprotein-releasing system permease protein